LERMLALNIGKNRTQELGKLQDRLGYRFEDIGLLNIALTHSSYANEKDLPRDGYNERLEFLGDAVLEMVVSEFLYNRFREYPEGALTKLRASLVKGQALGPYAAGLGLGEFLLMGKGEEASGGRKRGSILADAFEAVVGSMYLDGGYPAARDFIIRYINERISRLPEGGFTTDFKTTLQEKVQASGGRSVQYRLVSEQGPDHDKTFRVRVCIGDKSYGEGVGKSKKEAEQMAAKKAIERLEE
jgi:ribonuclease-3